MPFHHAGILNNIALLSDPEMGRWVQTEFEKQSPLSAAGIATLVGLSAKYPHWCDIEVEWVDGPGDLCSQCTGFDQGLNKCNHRYPSDNPALTPESNRAEADRLTLSRYPLLRNAKTLQEAHQIAIGRPFDLF